MVLVGLALLLVSIIALLIGADAGSLVGLTQMQTAQLLPLLVILIVIAGGLFARGYRLGELLGGIALWGGFFLVVGLGYAYRDEILGVAGRFQAELQPGVAMIDSERGAATFRRGLSGHFEIDTRVNGHLTPMLFDTGASTVVLTAADATAAGFDTNRLRYSVAVATANGTGMAAPIRLQTLEVGGIVRENVSAFVAAPEALQTSLLGLTFLQTLSRYSVTRNSLEMVD